MMETDYRLAHTLNAVVGWLELGNSREAYAELRNLPAEYLNDPEVLDVRWILHAREEDWKGAFEIAECLLRVKPASAAGWLHRAYAVRRMPGGGLLEAADALKPAAEMFPEESIIPFNLACYACQLGNLDEARRWLRESLRRQPDGRIKRLALDDDDLEPLWPEIKRWRGNGK
jgi:tetratricopeptide (TPR) repeat protein